MNQNDYQCGHCKSKNVTTLIKRFFKPEQVVCMVPTTSDIHLHCLDCDKIATVSKSGDIIALDVCPDCGEIEGVFEWEDDGEYLDDDDYYEDYGCERETYEFKCSSCGSSF